MIASLMRQHDPENARAGGGGARAARRDRRRAAPNRARRRRYRRSRWLAPVRKRRSDRLSPAADGGGAARNHRTGVARSEEHTSELQSLMRISYAVFCLKKKTNKKQPSYF